MTQFRNWCFTAFEDPEEKLKSAEIVRYAVFQKEKCPTTEREHWQGYVEFKKRLRLGGAREILPGAHWECRKGTREEAVAYCKKTESRISEPVEIGTFVSGGQNDGSKKLDMCRKWIEEGKTVDEIAELDFSTWVKHGKRLLDYQGVRMRRHASQNLRLDIQVEVHWGRTGTGKTRKVFETCGESLYKLDSANNIWWDGYMGEKVLLIDDFYGWIKFGALLNILDVYPLRLEVKGGFAYANWNKVYITSNKRWQEWYKDLTHEQHAALERRIHKTEIYD